MPLAVVLADVRAALFEYIIKTSQLLVIPYNITSLIQENHYRRFQQAYILIFWYFQQFSNLCYK